MTNQRLSPQNPRELTADEIDFVAGGMNNTTNTEAQVDFAEGSVLPETTELGKGVNPNTTGREDLAPPKSPNK